MLELISFLFISFLAGMLTAFAPCVLPIVPVILGGSVANKDKNRPFIIVLSLFVSIIVFTLILKASTVLIGVPTAFWNYLSGSIIILFGVSMALPMLWEKLQSRLGLYTSSNKFLGKAYKKGGIAGAIMVGAALGPVFSSCSPVYLLILSVALPANFAKGLLYVMAYAFGLCLVLLLVAKFGQVLIRKFSWLEDPNGLFKRLLGVFLIIVGLAILAGLDRTLQAWLIENGLYSTDLEQKLIK
jgi:cytochrome c-type biogenesis protein